MATQWSSSKHWKVKTKTVHIYPWGIYFTKLPFTKGFEYERDDGRIYKKLKNLSALSILLV